MDERLNGYNRGANYACVIVFAIITGIFLYKTNQEPRSPVHESRIPVRNTEIPVTEIPVTDQASEATVYANILAKEFQENELAAKRAWKDKIVIITGTVDFVRTDITGTAYLKMREGIQCLFPKHTQYQLERLSSGQSVKVKGQVSGMTLLTVLLRGCTLDIYAAQKKRQTSFSPEATTYNTTPYRPPINYPQTPLPPANTPLPPEQILNEYGTRAIRLGQGSATHPPKKSETRVIRLKSNY
jgi:hypothetical protein